MHTRGNDAYILNNIPAAIFNRTDPGIESVCFLNHGKCQIDY